MKVNIPTPAQTRLIARRLARKVAAARREKGKIIKKMPKGNR